MAKEHNKDVRFEIDVVEDLLPVDVDEGAEGGKGRYDKLGRGAGGDLIHPEICVYGSSKDMAYTWAHAINRNE